MALLEVRDLSVRFGGVVALDRVTFDVASGELVALIGPNGAGKTTLFNVITRVYRPSGGTVLVDGRSIQSIRPHNVIRHGLARTFQNLALFRSMTSRRSSACTNGSIARARLRPRQVWLLTSREPF